MRRFTRYVPPLTSTHGRTFCTHRLVMPCICGGVLVVVARFRAAAVPRLDCPCPLCECACVSVSTDIGGTSRLRFVYRTCQSRRTAPASSLPRLAVFASSILNGDVHFTQPSQYIELVKLRATEDGGEAVNPGTGNMDTPGDGVGNWGCRS